MKDSKDKAMKLLKISKNRVFALFIFMFCACLCINSAVFVKYPVTPREKLFFKNMPIGAFSEFHNAEIMGLPVKGFAFTSRLSLENSAAQVQAIFNKSFTVEKHLYNDKITFSGIVESLLTCVSIYGDENHSMMFFTQLLPPVSYNPSAFSGAPFFRFSSDKSVYEVCIKNILEFNAIEKEILKKLKKKWVLEKSFGDTQQGGYFFKNEPAELSIIYKKECAIYLLCEYKRIPLP